MAMICLKAQCQLVRPQLQAIAGVSTHPDSIAFKTHLVYRVVVGSKHLVLPKVRSSRRAGTRTSTAYGNAFASLACRLTHYALGSCIAELLATPELNQP